MGLELVGLRLLARALRRLDVRVGWALGAIMAALAGRLPAGAGDGRPPTARPAGCSAFSSPARRWVAGDLLATEAVLDASERLGATLGPVLATALLLAPPMLLPRVGVPVRGEARGAALLLGVTAGASLSPCSTAGSLAGTFVAACWWIPAYAGAAQTLRVLVAALVGSWGSQGSRGRTRGPEGGGGPRFSRPPLRWCPIAAPAGHRLRR